jgi:hypothetical protein
MKSVITCTAEQKLIVLAMSRTFEASKIHPRMELISHCFEARVLPRSARVSCVQRYVK